MPLVYDFTFADEFGGLNAVVTDTSGAEVDGSPLTLNSTGDGQLELDEGTYTATVSNTALALGNAKSTGVLNVAASIAAGGGGGGGGVGTYVQKVSGSIGDLSTPTALVFGGVDAEEGVPLRTDQFTLDGDTLTCIEAGTYRLKLWVQPKTDNGTVVTTPGTIAVSVVTSINGENKGPAWYFYPECTGFVDGTNTMLPSVTLNFPQPFDVDDELQILVSAEVRTGDIDPVFGCYATLELTATG